MREYDYRSAFADDIRAFLDFKASVGIYADTRNWTLWKFDQWCAERGATAFDKETVEAWALEWSARLSDTNHSWISYLRQLGKFMVANGRDAYILSDEFKIKKHREEPYLLTADEVERFFAAAARIDAHPPWAWQSTCLFGLMHACGLRPGECRRLLRDEVGWNGGYIDISKSKDNRSRRLPVTDEVIAMLEACDSRTGGHFGPDRPAFFVNALGRPMSGSDLSRAFGIVWKAAGLPESKGGKRPRPYDFRHRFAYANIERWAAEGANVDAMLPYLSRYMGHATFSSTYYYVHTSPDFMAGYADAAAPLDDVLPEVGFDD